MAQASTSTTSGSTGNGGKEYRYMGNYAMELPVGDALIWVAPGDFVTLTDAEAGMEKAQYTIANGLLVDVSTIGVEPDAEVKEASK
jgi:hypothetical protein